MLWPNLKSHPCFIDCFWEIISLKLIEQTFRSPRSNYTTLHCNKVYRYTLHCTILLYSIRVYLSVVNIRYLRNSWQIKGCSLNLGNSKFTKKISGPIPVLGKWPICALWSVKAHCCTLVHQPSVGEISSIIYWSLNLQFFLSFHQIEIVVGLMRGFCPYY